MEKISEGKIEKNTSNETIIICTFEDGTTKETIVKTLTKEIIDSFEKRYEELIIEQENNTSISFIDRMSKFLSKLNTDKDTKSEPVGVKLLNQ